MNKINKIIFAVLTSLSLISGVILPLTVKADPLPDQAKNGSASITIHKYQIDESFKGLPDYVPTGEDVKDQIIGSRKDENGTDVDIRISDLRPLVGVEFSVKKVIPKTDGSGNVLMPLEYEVDGTFIEEKVSIGASGYVTVPDLDFGIYEITELPNGAVVKPADPFYVSVPHYSETAGWIYDVHVYIKNQVKEPEIHKAVTEPTNQHDTTNVFDEVKWIVTSEIPEDVATSLSYVIEDNLDPVLQYVENSLKISYISNTNSEEVVLDLGTDYTFEVDKNSRTSYPWNDEMTITLTPAGRIKVADALPSVAGSTKAWLNVEFNTKIELTETDLETILGEKIPNQATLNYTNSLNVTFTPESEIPEVHLGGILLKKIDPRGEVLSGAKFKIYRTEIDALNGKNAIKTLDGTDWVVESDTNGMAAFFGLAYGDMGDNYNDPNAKTKYWIVEVEAPKDKQGKSYNLLREPLEVEVNRVSHEIENVITVINTRFDLPLTGGDGTVIFVIAGITLIALGMVAIVALKKKKAV